MRRGGGDLAVSNASPGVGVVVLELEVGACPGEGRLILSLEEKTDTRADNERKVERDRGVEVTLPVAVGGSGETATATATGVEMTSKSAAVDTRVGVEVEGVFGSSEFTTKEPTSASDAGRASGSTTPRGSSIEAKAREVEAGYIEDADADVEE